MKEKKTRVTFILPGRATYPVGGFKIVYEYANRLSDFGLEVTIVHIAWLYKSHPFIKGLIRYVHQLFFYRFYKKWFHLNSSVKNRWVFFPSSFSIPRSDFIIATSWETSEHVISLSKNKGEKLYFIQADESEYLLAIQRGWQQRVLNTWKFPMQKIVICSWLQDRVTELNDNVIKIFNGLNFDEFFIENPIPDRSAVTVMMLYHHSPVKGCEEGLKALRILKKEITDLKVILFGVPNKPKNLENWIEYHQKPSKDKLRSLYNEAAIFLSPSHSEGWGLPVAEALQCGCAVVTSDIGGFKDFVVDKHTGLHFIVKDVEDMVEKLRCLVKDHALRTALAEQGNVYVKQFTWERAASTMFNVLKKEN
jgi:glycosyltransferase involved in cell wall biosynthesis